MQYIAYQNHNGWILTTEADYRNLFEIHRAMKARTWGEFMAALPWGEHDELLDRDPGLYYEGTQAAFDRLDDEEKRELQLEEPYCSDTRFHHSDIPGFDEGDFPPSPGVVDHIPDKLCEDAYDEFGNYGAGFMDAVCWIEDNRMDELAAWFESKGHALVRWSAP